MKFELGCYYRTLADHKVKYEGGNIFSYCDKTMYQTDINGNSLDDLKWRKVIEPYIENEIEKKWYDAGINKRDEW